MDMSQSNYAAANTFLDAFTQYRQSKGLPSSTVDIRVMEGIGYVSRNANVLGDFHQTSTHVLREQDLLDSIQLLLQRGCNSRHSRARNRPHRARVPAP